MIESWNEYPILTNQQCPSTVEIPNGKLLDFVSNEGVQMQSAMSGSCYGKIANFNYYLQTFQTTLGELYKPENVQNRSRGSTFTVPDNTSPLRGFSQEAPASEVISRCPVMYL
jgi:hypothetical protein